ncbi:MULTISPECIES: TetR/AcrR family transcriptional regulator [unclassified Microcoleus]|uniref:TetR/AcrR family transcriptional regulator n=1 Tax=unclassified Microcoleus TaxID=2642155 RepID=UPI001D6B561C|nr:MULTISPECIES: TetR/AcrR family transcriptional regulator [unclassified Microcoleus]MCC3429287.1 TetR/AcrR family transcriptional regulator [Microcoleus sp. PH2017_04_SCI_O_A]MCC3440394.1 TetR/AcrR family transcriptional regulator [Microcoleus sp. PH2017_03_ELD_O_A]MCC3466596.1 TetR/AcrR family transcriptional regulator [Microcoleus sp. PH2017_06_SFM_O_A]MCC3501704.1 TetR/AcrR family transcriptional regulator [Microcoleus sp. PH2017_19_SFW_U_A]TAE71128.1 MAG: TetR/AcrR family transcriptional
MPKIVDSEEYRKELLHRCFNLFAESGYASVTTRQISKALGISTGAMYHYFASKQVLFEQLVEEISWQDVYLFKSIAEGGTLTERIERLGCMLVQHEEHFVKQAVIWTDFYQHTAVTEINSNPIFQQIDRRYQQMMEELLNLSDPKLARFVWTLINGILIEQIERENSFSFAQQIHLFTKMLIAYCEKYCI